MAVLLALFSAFAYGLSDFVGGLVARRTSAWPVAVVGQLASTACTAALAATWSGDPEGTDFAWAALAGLAGGVGTGFLYRGLAAGRMSVVAPISAVGAAAVPVLVGTLTGERPAGLVWLGIVLALPGIWLVSSTPEPLFESTDAAPGGRRTAPPIPLPVRQRGSLAEGVVDGVLAGLGFGLLFAALGQVPDSAGLWPLALTQAVSIVAAVLLALVLKAAWLPRDRAVWWALIAGLLGASAAAAFLLATQQGLLAIAGVLAALYPATTVVLAALVLREHIHRVQGVGLVVCALAIGLVAGGQ